MTNGRPQDEADPMKPSGDMSLALEVVRGKHPNSKICGLGYSLGGNFLANYLGSRPNSDCAFTCGVTVCSPMEVTGLSYWIEHRYKMVDAYLRQCKTECLINNRSVIECDSETMKRGVDVDKIIAAPSFRAQVSNNASYGFLKRCSNLLFKFSVSLIIYLFGVNQEKL